MDRDEIRESVVVPEGRDELLEGTVPIAGDGYRGDGGLLGGPSPAVTDGGIGNRLQSRVLHDARVFGGTVAGYGIPIASAFGNVDLVHKERNVVLEGEYHVSKRLAKNESRSAESTTPFARPCRKLPELPSRTFPNRIPQPFRGTPCAWIWRASASSR